MICGPGPVLYLLLAFLLNINQAGLVTTQLTGDVRHKVKMGEKNVACDDGATNLAVDWLDSPLNYTCYHPTTPPLPSHLPPLLECEDLPTVRGGPDHAAQVTDLSDICRATSPNISV